MGLDSPALHPLPSMSSSLPSIHFPILHLRFTFPSLRRHSDPIFPYSSLPLPLPISLKLPLSWPFHYTSNTYPINLYFKPLSPASRLSKLFPPLFPSLSIISLPSSNVEPPTEVGAVYRFI